MTPYEIDVLLWYYARCEDHPDMVRNPPVWRPTIDGFKADNLLTSGEELCTRGTCYSLTERGTAYVEALQRVPLPTSRWVIEWPKADAPTRT